MTSPNRDYYQILGVPSDATFDEIRSAFRDRAREFHPDRNPSPDAVERMQEINEAYEVLRDAEQRAAYDRARRTLGASAEELARAKAIAAMVLGQVAFNLGFAISKRISNHWIERIHRLEDIPTGVWHAGYEVALESALTGRSESEILLAALDAARSAVQFESARLAYRHALAERAQTFTESFAVDIEVNILGSTAAVIGFALGRQNIRESLPASAWNQADEAIRQSVNRSIQLRGGVVTPQTLRDNSFINSVFDDAAQEANRVLRPHAENIGRRIGRSPNRGGAVAPSGRAGNGCVANIIGTIIMIGIVILLGSLCRVVTAEDDTFVPASSPPSQATSPSLSVDRQDPVPKVGDCIGSGGYELVPCGTGGAKRINYVHLYPSNAPWPGSQFYTDARNYCPPSTTQFTHPEREYWQAGIKVLFCVD